MQLPQLSALSTVGIGVALTAVATGWSQVKNVLVRLVGLLIISVEANEKCFEAMNAYAWTQLKRTPSPFRYYTGFVRFIQPLARHGAVAYETLGAKGQIFWDGWRPIWIRMDPNYGGRVAMRFIRGTFNPDKLIHNAMGRATFPEKQLFWVVDPVNSSTKIILAPFFNRNIAFD